MEKKGNIIGICVAKMQDDTRQKQVRAICSHLEENGFRVMIFNTFLQLDAMDSFKKGEADILERIPMFALSALVIFTESFLNTDVTNELVQRAHQKGLPVISVDNKIDGCFNVLFAYEESFERIVRHIVEHHHCKKINFMAGFKDNEFSDVRINTCKKVLKENGISFEEERLAYGQFWEMPARHNCERWVKMWEDGIQERPDAIICANDIMALTVLNVLNNHGIRVPEDVLLTGFDGLELEQYCTPRLTTACDDIELLGKEIVSILRDYEENDAIPPYDRWIPFQTKFSESCGCTEIAPCNPNEQIMFLYGRSALMRGQSTDTFLMMTVLTDGYSAVEMAKKLETYQNMISVDSMMIILNSAFYSATDIYSDNFEQGSMLLLTQIRDGKYSTPLKEIKPCTEYSELQWMMDTVGQILCIPLHWQEEVYGFMVVSYKDCDKDLGAFYEFVLGFEQVLGTIRKQSLLHNMYITDMLTELYNRRGFYNILEQNMEMISPKKAVLFLASVDMDGLKFINDTYGHSEGDYAIKTVAHFLKESLEGHQGVCARFGGDEYMVAIITDEENADIPFYEQYSELLQKRVSRFEQKSNKPYEIGVSVGTIYGSITNFKDIDVLMKKADDMMYDCKCGHHASRTAKFRSDCRR
ncbi:MAG: GGDEF domain-containing protein [Butyribacter sp.]|nr:GGDEF domain-containing protein [bacterium]MDY3855420.1 GGDEF domain-containing protein [Butyribacter sp.]